MSKYVCDFGQVTNAGGKLVNAGNKLKNTASSYSSGIESNLSQWTGVAKDSFSSSNASQVEAMNAQGTYLCQLGEFIKTAAKNIETLDNDLASLEI